MKYLLYLSLLFVISSSLYGQPASYNPINTYVPDKPDWDLLMKAADTRIAQYEQNKNYRDKMIDWIFALKAKITDSEFLNSMDKFYKQLRAMDGQDYGAFGYQLDIIKQNIKEEIDNYNSKIKELPKRLWDTGNNDFKFKWYNEAIEKYTELIQISPEFIYTYMNRGLAYFNLKKYSNAIGDFNKFIENKKDDPSAYYNIAWAKYYQKDYIGALTDFNKKIELDPQDYSGYFSRGLCKDELGDTYGAIIDDSKTIELKPEYSMAYNNRGWAKFKQKKYSEALIDVNRSIELDPENSTAYDSRQEIKFNLNDLKGCIEDCNKALAINPNISNSYFIRGRAYYKQGEKSKACENWSKGRRTREN